MSNPLQLYDHNQEASDIVENKINNGENIVGLLHATGSGKTFIALDLIRKFSNKKILYVTRYNSIIEHIQEIISTYPELNETLLKNTKFITYTALVNYTREELAALDIDILITDEFHHVGAPVWQNRIETIVETHPNLKIIGMSAYSVRDRGTPYERDMADPGGNEIFSDKICSYYPLSEAMIDGIIPIPRYHTAVTILESFIDTIESKIKRKYPIDSSFYNLYVNILTEIRKKLDLNMVMDELLRRNINIGDKLLYFCPTNTVDNEDNINRVIEETKEKLLSLGYKEEDMIFYKSTVKMPDRGVKSREAFYRDEDLDGKDVSGKLRIMFAINQYNEGVHVPNLDGVILGRGTRSDIVFFEQIGRALSIRGNTKEKIEKYQKMTIEELRDICTYRKIPINDSMSKDDIIERIVSPLIIDLAGNFVYIRDLIRDIKYKLKEKSTSPKSKNKPALNITDQVFDIEIIGESIFEILEGLNNLFEPRNFDEVYELATNFYNNYGHLNIPRNFKTDDGINYNEFGYSLGEWLSHMRSLKNKNELSEEIIVKLEKLNIVWKLHKTFDDVLALATIYYEEHGDLNVPSNYKTKDGYGLGTWIASMRHRKKIGTLNPDQIEALDKIGMIWQKIQTFNESYKLLKIYYDYYGNIEFTSSFKTTDGINIDPNGFDLREWLNNQISSYHRGELSKEKIKLLEKLGVIWGEKKETDKLTWDESFALAKKYYDFHGHLKIKRDFKTKNGITYDENGYNLGRWITRQQVNKKKNKLTETQIEMLNQIGMIWQVQEDRKTWEESYLLAVAYYEQNGHLNVPTDYRTEDGYNLSSFLYHERRKRQEGELTEEQIYKLDQIGMIWNRTENYAEIKQILREKGLNPRKYSSQVINLSLLEFKAKLRFIEENRLPLVVNQNLNSIFNMSNKVFQATYGIAITSLIEQEISYRKN